MRRVGEGPPRWAEWLLARLLDAADRDVILDDLHEEHGRRAGEAGDARAAAWYWRQVAGAVVPSLRLRASRRARSAHFGRRTHAGGRMVAATLDALWSDVRVAGRGLLRRPAYTGIAVATLGIAMGANAATFGILDAVLLKALPYPEADRIVLVSELHGERLQEAGWSSVPNLLDWKAQARSFEALGLFRGRSMALTGDGDPAYAYGAFVTPDFFAVFGTGAALGRVMAAGDGAAGAAPVVVIGHGLWQRRFGGAPSVLGRTVVVDGIARTVIGVMPPSFTAPNEWIGAAFPLDVWVPFVVDPATQARGNRSYSVVGRLRRDVDVESASAEMSLIGARLARAWPEANEGWTIRLDGWRDTVVGGVRETLLLMAGAMALVLLVACANVGNLALNRALGRRAEFAVRAALGAGARRIARVAVIESLLLAALAAAAGLLLAHGLIGWLVALEPADLPLIAGASVDFRVFAATFLVSLLVGLLVGAIPALQARGPDTARILGAAGRAAGGSRRWRRFRDALAVAQLAMALALLAGSALVGGAFQRLRAVTPGLEAEGVLTATVALSWDRVPTIEHRVAFVEAALERLRALPGVESAAMINSLPFSGSHQQQTFTIDGVPAPPDGEPFAALRGVSPDYAGTMRIPLRGRELAATDLTGPPAVAMVNEAFARRYLADRDAMGTRLLLQDGELRVEVVGVVGDIRHYGLSEPARPEIYLPLTADYLTSKSFVVRTSGDPYALAEGVGRAIHDVDPEQPLRGVEGGLGVASTISMSDLIGASVAALRFHTSILLLLAAMAVLLSAIGLFAVVSQAVTERSREIGVRVALGAERRRVIVWILSWGGRLALAAAVGGILLALAAGRALEALLFGASARDPLTLGVALAGFGAIVVAAILIPAARATRVDPAVVLREP